MLTVDAPLAADARFVWWWDRIDLFIETVAIECELAILEQRHGPHAELEDARQRVRVVRAGVLLQLQQLCALLDPTAETVH